MSTSERQRLLKIRWKIGVIFRLNFNPSCRGLFLGCSSSQRIALLSKKVHFLHHRARMEDVVWRGGRNFTGSLEKMTSSKKKHAPCGPCFSTLCCSTTQHPTEGTWQLLGGFFVLRLFAQQFFQLLLVSGGKLRMRRGHATGGEKNEDEDDQREAPRLRNVQDFSICI